MKTFLVKGVPASIQRDGWWMDGPIRRRPVPAPKSAHSPGWERPALLIAFIALADLLLWGAVPGLSLALFGLALLGAGLALTRGRSWGGMVLGAIFFLPLIEQSQLLSLLFFLSGLLVGGTWIALGGWPGLRAACLGALRLLGHGPLQSIRDIHDGVTGHAPGRPLTQRVDRFTLGWALPLGLGLVFLSLLIEANPVLQSLARQADRLQLPDLERVFFWGGAALIIWPFLRLASLRQRLVVAARQQMIGPRRRPAVLNPQAIGRSLILFNLLFLAQTSMDATYLIGGADLPDGMTYAQYAHRGAYPLLITALLAGAFALVARPFTDVDGTLRTLLLLWMGQTILLVLSSLLRLELYVEAYGLTRLRLAAAIWMTVVATGLGLTLWQIIGRHGTGWWLKRCTMLGLVTLYGCLFFSFDKAIAEYNLGFDVPLDPVYLCSLEAAALPAITRFERDRGTQICSQRFRPHSRAMTDWREWGFRDWRVLRSLAALEAAPSEPTGGIEGTTWPRY